MMHNQVYHLFNIIAIQSAILLVLKYFLINLNQLLIWQLQVIIKYNLMEFLVHEKMNLVINFKKYVCSFSLIFQSLMFHLIDWLKFDNDVS